MTQEISAAIEEAATLAMQGVPSDEPEELSTAEQPDEPAPAEPAADEPDADADAEPPAEEPAAPAEGVVVPPALTEGLVAEFVVRDAEGEVEIPDITIQYKANGKVRTDRLDQVVKLAQWGVYNEEKVKRVEQVEQHAQAVEAELASREEALERMLRDEDYYLAVREAYESESSPEKRAERAEQEAQDLRLERELAPIHAQGKQFFENEVAPALDMIVQALPSVTREELEARVEDLLLRHTVKGPGGTPIVPPQKYDAIRRAMVDDIAIWAKVLHARRTPPAAPAAASPAKKPDAALDRARIDAQKAKRAVGRAMRPVATAGVSKSTPPKANKQHATVDDAMEDALANVLGGIS
jgi:hypothetical protein